MSPAFLLSRLVRPFRLHAVGVAVLVFVITLSQGAPMLRDARATAVESLPAPVVGPAAATFDPFAPKPQALPAPDPASDRVGSTVGEFKVGEDGGANYRVPIFTVPGRAGVAPQLALTYSTRGAASGRASRAGRRYRPDCHRIRSSADRCPPGRAVANSAACRARAGSRRTNSA